MTKDERVGLFLSMGAMFIGTLLFVVTLALAHTKWIQALGLFGGFVFLYAGMALAVLNAIGGMKKW